MRTLRFRHGGFEGYGFLDEEEDLVYPVEGDVFGVYHVRDGAIPLMEVTLLAPVVPGKVLAAAVNYGSHAAQSRSLVQRDEAPSVPQMFLKPASCIIGPNQPIVLPPGAGRVDAEGELVVVMGAHCRHAPPEEALDYVYGYTCGNDVSARVWQRGDLQWWRAKGSDTFGPVGPWIVQGLDPARLRLITRVNGEVRQDSTTDQLIHGVPALISFISSVMALEPGDLIFTGTPGETPTLSPGDVVEVEIEGVGVLRNPVEGAEE